MFITMVSLIKKFKRWWYSFRAMAEEVPLTCKRIENKMKYYGTKNCYVEATDRMYLTCEFDTLQNIVKAMPIKYGKYVTEEHDCDDFAREFWCLTRKIWPHLPIGYCHVKTKNGLHALNFCIHVTEKGTPVFNFIEPQTGKIRQYDYKPYLMII